MRSEYDDRLALLVFRRGLDLIAGQFEGDAVVLILRGGKSQRIPIDRDLAAADAEEAAEIDDRGARRPVRSTMTSTIRPMSSSAALRTVRPRMPSASCLYPAR